MEWGSEWFRGLWTHRHPEAWGLWVRGSQVSQGIEMALGSRVPPRKGPQWGERGLLGSVVGGSTGRDLGAS